MNQRQGRRVRRDRYSPKISKIAVRGGDSLLQPSAQAEGVHKNLLLRHYLTTLIGCEVEVQLKEGEVYEGVLRTISPSMDISLSVVHLKGKPPTMENVYDRREFKFSDVVAVSAKTGSNPQLGIFKTDTEISGRSNGPQSRELQPFTDFGEDNSNDMTLFGNSKEMGWCVEEMFSVNEHKFQVTSSYNEELPQYTTQLVRDGEDYQQREVRAMKLANEIEAKDVMSRHGIDDTGTEEERFSAVQRASGTAGSSERSQEVLSASAPQANGASTSSVSTSHMTPPLHISSSSSSSSSIETPPTSTPHQFPLSTPHSSHSHSHSHSKTSVDETGSHSSSSLASGGSESTSTGCVVVAPDADEAGHSDGAKEISEGVASMMSTEMTSLSHSLPHPITEDLKSSVPSREDVGGSVDNSCSKEYLGSSDGSLCKEEPSSQEMEKDDLAESEEDKAKKEETIKNFKLNPTAKEFVSGSMTPPGPSFSPVSSSWTSASPLSVQGSPSSTYHYQGQSHSSSRYQGGQRSARPPRGQHTQTHVHTPPHISPEQHVLQAVASPTNYILQQQPFRPILQQAAAAAAAAAAGFSYPVPPNPMVGGVMQSVISNPQMITTPSRTQLIGAAGNQQQFSLGTMAQPQFLTPTQQLFTSQAVVSPVHQPPTLYVQTAALQQPQPQVMTPTPGVTGVTSLSQQLAGTTATSMSQMLHYQMPGTGKQ